MVCFLLVLGRELQMMDSAHDDFIVAAGCGGKAPRVEMVAGTAPQPTTILNLQEGESAYSLSISADGESIAAGTKAGFIYVTETVANAGSEAFKLVQGAPVTSVCFSGDSLLASADIVGRCFLWPLSEGEGTHTELRTNGEIVCALVSWDQYLLGLTMEGEILAWALDSGDVSTIGRGARPPAKGALVRLIAVPETNAIVYPAEDGDICVFRPGTANGELLPCHDGEFYAMARARKFLITAGCHDKSVKFWDLDLEQHGPSLSTDRASIAVAAEGGREGDRIFLVDEHGCLRVCAVEEAKLRATREFGPRAYRTVICSKTTISSKARRERVRSIAKEIREKIGTGEREGIEQLHSQLCGLGFESISLELRAEQAQYDGDIPRELHARKKQAHLLPDEPGSVDSLASYASLCQQVWQLEEAWQQYRRINEIAPSAPTEDQQRRLHSYLRAMDHGTWVAGPTEVSLEVVGKSASVMDTRLTGWWIISTGEQQNFQRTDLRPEEIARIYEEKSKESGNEGLPEARCEQISWLSEWEINQVEAIVCRKEDEVAGGELRFGLLFMRQSPDAVIIPAVIFRAAEAGEYSTSGEHNEAVLDAFRETTASELNVCWLDRVQDALTFALRRLVTREMSPWAGGRR
jgi:hypothetical protein